MVWNKGNKSTVIPITALEIHLIEIGDYKDIKIILKELKDISEEEAKEIWKKAFNCTYNYHRKYYHDQLISVIKGGCSFPAVIDKMYHSYTMIDFLRSKGYAVGINKEFYTTEDHEK